MPIATSGSPSAIKRLSCTVRARTEIATWDSNDPAFFAKLYLYTAANPARVV